MRRRATRNDVRQHRSELARTDDFDGSSIADFRRVDECQQAPSRRDALLLRQPDHLSADFPAGVRGGVNVDVRLAGEE